MMLRKHLWALSLVGSGICVCLVAAVAAGVFHDVQSHTPVSDTAFPSLDKSRGQQIATRDSLLTLFNPQDSSSIFTVFDAINRHPALAQNCHEIGHDLGHKAYELYGFSGAMALNQQQHQGYIQIGEICAGGYMHGVLEELLVHEQDLKTQINRLCLPVPLENRASCFHGIGHGLMFLNARNTAESLADCQTVGKLMNQTHCDEGVWMELFWGDTSHVAGQALGWLPDQPLLPCIQAPIAAKPSCFLYANLGYLRMHTRDFAGAIALCSASTLSSSDARFCMKGIGMTMMQYFLSHHLDHPETFVATLDTDERSAYYQGLIAYARLSAVQDDVLDAFCHTLTGDQGLCLSILQHMPR